MKLFLTSQGLVLETTPFFLKLLGRKPESCRAAFIPTAADYKRERGFWVSNDMARLEELGFDVTEIDIKAENEKSLAEKLKMFDVVFVCGGNTFYLMKCIRESGFDAAIRKFLKCGGIYVGVSAGSMVAGLNIKPAGWKHADANTVRLKDHTGMLLAPFAVSAHIDDSNTDAVKKRAKKAGYPTVGLTDKQAVQVVGGKWKVVGEGEPPFVQPQITFI